MIRNQLILILLAGAALLAQSPSSAPPTGTFVKVRLKTGDEVRGRLLHVSEQSVDLEIAQGNQINIREIARAEIETLSADPAEARLAGVADYARRLTPGMQLQIKLLDGKKVDGRLLRTSAGSLDLDQTKGAARAYRLVAYSDIETIQVKTPRQGRPLLALAPGLVYMALQVARAF